MKTHTENLMHDKCSRGGGGSVEKEKEGMSLRVLHLMWGQPWGRELEKGLVAASPAARGGKSRPCFHIA